MRWQSATLSSWHARQNECCDACGALPEEGPHTPLTHGMYLWARDGRVRRESVPLCGRCSAAVGMAVLARATIEEEEG